MTTLLQQPITVKPGETLQAKLNDVLISVHVSETRYEGAHILKVSLLNPADPTDILDFCLTTTLG